MILSIIIPGRMIGEKQRCRPGEPIEDVARSVAVRTGVHRPGVEWALKKADGKGVGLGPLPMDDFFNDGDEVELVGYRKDAR